MTSCSQEECSFETFCFSISSDSQSTSHLEEGALLDSDSFPLCLEIMQVCVSEDLAFPERSLGEMHDLPQANVMNKAFSGA